MEDAHRAGRTAHVALLLSPADRRGRTGKLADEVRAVLRADLGACPYGEPPAIESTDGDEIALEKRNWSIDGQPIASVMPPYKCGWIVATPDACAGCKLNPKNAPEQSLRLAFILRLEAMQAAGAVFYIDDLKPEDWRDLLTVKSERNRRQYEELNKKG